MKVFSLIVHSSVLARALGEPDHVMQVRANTVARSQKEAAEKFGTTVGHLRNYGGETGNAEDIAMAAKHPDLVVCRRKNVSSPEYVVAACVNRVWEIREQG